MSVQLTWDTFSTLRPHYDSNAGITTSPKVVEPATSLHPVIVPGEVIEPAETLISEEYTLPDTTQFEGYKDLQSSRIYSEEHLAPHGAPDITFSIEGNPNELLWKTVIGSRPGAFDRSHILANYKTLGKIVKIEGDRGLADMARRREANYAQFFTPSEIVRFITAALGLEKTDRKPIVVDNSCGIGKMFEFLSPSCLKTGIELEEQAYHMAARLWPDAHIVNDSLINYPAIGGDYFLINPPFSIQLEQKNIPLENTGWGDFGPNSSIQSHIAALEIAIANAGKYVAALLPQGYFVNESTRTFEKWVNGHAELVLRVDIPAEHGKGMGYEWPCSIVIYHTKFSHYNWKSAYVRTIEKLSDLDSVLEDWKRTQHYNDALEELSSIDNQLQHHARLQIVKQQGQAPVITPALPVPDEGVTGVKIALSPDSSNLIIKPSNLLEALRIQQLLDAMGQSWNDGLKEYTQEADVQLRRKHILNDPSTMGLRKNKLASFI